MNLLEGLFVVSFVLMIYPYLLFPLLVRLWARLAGKGWQPGETDCSIAMIVSVYNEEGVIREKIENALAMDYPTDRFTIVVVSDGSTDDTESIVKGFNDPRVVLKAYERAGKTACLNRVVQEVDSDILVFTDANSMFPPQMLHTIVRNFADAEVGLVTGWTKYRRSGSNEEEAPGAYARLEKMTKEAESQLSSCVGADGAIFAIRRPLYRELEDRDINDFVIPLNVIGQGYRTVLDPEVYCLEEPSEGAQKEFRRQIRITNRTLGAIRRNAEFLNYRRYGSFSLFLLSHKILRFMVPFFMLAAVVSSFLLIGEGALYTLAFLGLLAFILLGIAGLKGYIVNRISNLCGTFLLTAVAQLMGWWRFVTGQSDTLWTPQR